MSEREPEGEARRLAWSITREHCDWEGEDDPCGADEPKCGPCLLAFKVVRAIREAWSRGEERGWRQALEEVARILCYQCQYPDASRWTPAEKDPTERNGRMVHGWWHKPAPGKGDWFDCRAASVRALSESPESPEPTKEPQP